MRSKYRSSTPTLILVILLVPFFVVPQMLEASGDAKASGEGAGGAITGSTPPAAPGDPTNAAVTQAAKHSLPGSRPLAKLLGMSLEQAYKAFGAPADVFPVRGQEAWEDDVVFYYPDHTYLFWFRNRVWQVRADKRFSGKVMGVEIGQSRSQVERILGTPYHSGDHSDIFLVENTDFPIRARLFFSDGVLSDIYIYRGDF